MRRRVAKNWKLVLGIAVALDLLIIFGPPLNSNGQLGLTMILLLPRWFVMIVGGLAFIWAQKHGVLAERLAANLYLYLIFGFTLAAVLNHFLGNAIW